MMREKLRRGTVFVLGACAVACVASACSSTPAPQAAVDAASSGDDGASSGDDGGTGPACSPDQPYQPMPWFPPAAWGSGACTKQQMTDFNDACAGANASAQACSTFQDDAANKDCLACLFTKVGIGPAYGPFLVENWGGQNVFYPNWGGCVAHVDGKAGASDCGGRIAVVFDCLYGECAGCATQAESDACISKAKTGPCKPYLLAPGCYAEFADGGVAASICDTADSFDALWCGPPSDAGTPPSDGGSGGG